MNPNDPVLPSSLLSPAEEDYGSVFNYNFNNFSLKVGLVKKTYNIEDKDNINKKMPEYDVLVFEQHSDQGVASTTYPHCIFLETFGGLGDYFEFKKRSPTDAQLQDPANSDGATVLMLCVDGVAEKGLIIGAIPHPSRKSTLTKEAGAHMEGQFNGLNWQVNKDGALTVTFNSAMDNKGKKADEESAGTFVEINKKGSVDVNTNLEGKEETYIRMDKPNKDIGLKAGQHIGLTAEKNIGLTAGESVNVTAKKDLIAMAEGKAAFTISKTLDIEAKGATSIKTKELKVVSKTMINMKAQSMIQLEAASSMILKAPTVLIGPAAAQPALLAYDLITMGIGNLGAPVIGQAIAGYSTSVIISS